MRRDAVVLRQLRAMNNSKHHEFKKLVKQLDEKGG